jgi:hypothetical protein
MSKEKKSMIDLIDITTTIPNIDQAVKTIHQSSKERQVKTSVAIPESLHKELKKIAIDEGIDLRRFILQAVLDKCEAMEHPLKGKYAGLL